ncbi:MAG TPA: accessory factor UbiK family protein [Pseudomonadales bacterium]|jgi:hypothetical protein
MPLERPAERIESLLRQLESTLGSSDFNDDLRRNLRALLTAWLARLDVVPRDEFDAQAAVLENTRRKLDALEQELGRITEEMKRR